MLDMLLLVVKVKSTSPCRSEDGSEYLHVVFGTSNDPTKFSGGVIDAEFLFLSGTSLC